MCCTTCYRATTAWATRRVDQGSLCTTHNKTKATKSTNNANSTCEDVTMTTSLHNLPISASTSTMTMMIARMDGIGAPYP